MENWKAIKNYEGLYEVSDLGRSILALHIGWARSFYIT